ncbi:M56 family metallopeptidase [Sphingomonas nostoxanthinifaciens]|uniref:M56 family metallopeptidase n=1 Tax=Sphingomonas nostoxanthinifaciens TaxID=2872652 RepID=UPI001CC1CF54|nr:M56 family metallopeptidase [Sphingomonas nostoxanthinifaciens]UAK23351.1 M56 family metallopeptidase [Sphingomonas nostoxanthinifaciens]
MNAWIVDMLVSSSLLMLLVLGSRRLVASLFGAHVAYALWLLPALRIVLPPIPGLRTLYQPVLVAAPVQAIRVGIAPPGAVADPFVLPPDLADAIRQAPPSIDWPSLLIALWAAVAVLWFAFQILRYGLFVRKALARATHLSTISGVDVYSSDNVEGPIASGLLHRRIFLPRDFLDRYSSAERRQALLHEAAHHDRHDLVANVLAIATVAVHWWNPLAHIAHRAFRADQEMACDATVLGSSEPGDAYDYGAALVKSTIGRAPAAACAFNRAQGIKRRLKMIKQGRLSWQRRLFGGALALTAIGSGLVLTATGSSAAVEPQAARAVAPPDTADAVPLAPIPADNVAPVERPAPPAAPALPNPIARFTPPPRPIMPPVAITDRAVRAAEMQARTAERVARAKSRIAERYARTQSRDAERYARAQSRIAERQARAAERQAAASAASRRTVIYAPADSEIRQMVSASLTRTRAQMASSCAARGTPISAGERDWSRIALCGDPVAINIRIIHAMQAARDQIGRQHDAEGDAYQRMLNSIDAAIARMKSRTAS